MHITILADSIDNQKAGVHTYTKNLILALRKIDKKNRYSFIHERENSFFADTENYIIPSKKGYGRDSLRKFFKIPRLIKRLNPDIVIEPCHIGPFNLPKSIKRVTVIHDLTPLLFPQFHLKKSVIVHKLLLGRILKNADLIITNSNRTKKDISKIYGHSQKTKAILLGANPPENTGAKIKPKNGALPYFLFVGTLEPRKNLPLLIEAFLESTAGLETGHQLIIAGEPGWRMEKFHEMYKHPSVIFKNFVDEGEKASLYAGAQALIYPSIYEGFGLPPLEAMLQGTPVICSSGGSLQEIYKKYSLMFDPKNKAELKKHILKVINDKKSLEGMTKKAKAFAETMTWEQTAKLTLQELEKLLKNDHSKK